MSVRIYMQNCIKGVTVPQFVLYRELYKLDLDLQSASHSLCRESL